MSDEKPQFEISADELMWDQIDLDASLSPEEAKKYKNLIGGGLIFVDPIGNNNANDFMYLSEGDIESMISEHRVPGDRKVWLHSSYGGELETTLGEIKRTRFIGIVDEDGQPMTFSAPVHVSGKLLPIFSLPPANQKPNKEKSHQESHETEADKKDKEEESPLIAKINEDFENGLITEEQRDEFIQLAEEENLIYVDINGTPQYLSKEYVQWLIDEGNDPSLEVEIVLSATGEHEGEKVALEELIPILDRPDSGGVSNRVEESSVDEESKEKDIPTDAVPIPEEKEGDADPNHIDLPEGFAPPENLQSLSNDLPKVSAALPGDGTLEEKDSIKVSHKGREEGVALSDRPHQMLVDLGEEQAELEEDNPMDMLPDGIKAPQAPQKGPAGQQQQKQKDAEKEAAKKQQKNVDDQLKKSEEDGEKEDEQKPNRVNNNSFRSGGGKGILRKAAPWAVGGGIGLGMASPFALNSLSASAHYEPLLSLISILV